MNSLKKIKQPFSLTIFGASGNLAKLKLFPAIYELYTKDKLPKNFKIIGFARSQMNDEKFRKIFKTSIKKQYKKFDENKLEKLLKKIHYFKGNYEDNFIEFKKFLDKFIKKKNYTNLNYLSVPPNTFKSIIKNLAEIKNKSSKTQIIIEKPFGEDMKSAKSLFKFILKYFDEKDFYLLDHYLGKDLVQYIRKKRLNTKDISNIQITSFENTDVEERLGYFNQVGIIKDMIQSHLLQLLASIFVTKKDCFKFLKSLSFRNEVIIGQYQKYCDHKFCDLSKTETFCAIKLLVKNKIPIYIRVGKNINKHQTYVVLEYKNQNKLILELYPNTKIIFKENKTKLEIEKYIDCESKEFLGDYSKMILASLNQKKDIFVTFKEVSICWKIIDKIENFIKQNKIPLEMYKSKTNGPKSQNKIIEQDGFSWYYLK